MRGVSKDGRESMLCGHPSRRIGFADAPQDEGIISFTNSELNFGQFGLAKITQLRVFRARLEFLTVLGAPGTVKKFARSSILQRVGWG